MEKIAIFLLLFTLGSWGDLLEQKCLWCHKKEQVPSALIYKRYLLHDSTKSRIAHSMEVYLKEPQEEHSIMPRQFFLKFPMKKPLNLDDATLKRAIDAFIERFDIQKRLRLRGEDNEGMLP